jgi:hypothetical protein
MSPVRYELGFYISADGLLHCVTCSISLCFNNAIQIHGCNIYNASRERKEGGRYLYIYC